MREFFKPWRRKLGVATLVMACVFAAGWVRSFSMKESVYSGDRTRLFAIHSLCGSIWLQEIVDSQKDWHGTNFKSTRLDRSFKKVQLESGHRIDGSELLMNPKYVDSHRNWRLAGFCYSGGKTFGGANDTVILVGIPYWSVATPLALISAYLLLSNPRAKPKQTVPHA